MRIHPWPGHGGRATSNCNPKQLTSAPAIACCLWRQVAGAPCTAVLCISLHGTDSCQESWVYYPFPNFQDDNTSSSMVPEQEHATSF
jgi:hypothetical protein